MSEKTGFGKRPRAPSAGSDAGAPAPAGTSAGAGAPTGGGQQNASSPGEFRVGGALSRIFSVFFRNFIPFVLLALIILSPTYIYALVAGTDPMTDATSGGQGAAAIMVAHTFRCWRSFRGRKNGAMMALSLRPSVRTVRPWTWTLRRGTSFARLPQTMAWRFRALPHTMTFRAPSMNIARTSC